MELAPLVSRFEQDWSTFLASKTKPDFSDEVYMIFIIFIDYHINSIFLKFMKFAIFDHSFVELFFSIFDNGNKKVFLIIIEVINLMNYRDMRASKMKLELVKVACKVWNCSVPIHMLLSDKNFMLSVAGEVEFNMLSFDLNDLPTDFKYRHYNFQDAIYDIMINDDATELGNFVGLTIRENLHYGFCTAAYLGAVKCFRYLYRQYQYLLENESGLEDIIDEEVYDNAISGNSLEIISLLFREGCDTTDWIFKAIQAHNFKLAALLAETPGVSPYEPHQLTQIKNHDLLNLVLSSQLKRGEVINEGEFGDILDKLTPNGGPVLRYWVSNLFQDESIDVLPMGTTNVLDFITFFEKKTERGL